MNKTQIKFINNKTEYNLFYLVKLPGCSGKMKLFIQRDEYHGKQCVFGI